MYSQVFFICAVYNDHLKNKYSDLFFRKKNQIQWNPFIFVKEFFPAYLLAARLANGRHKAHEREE